jgi:hypothetical protein
MAEDLDLDGATGEQDASDRAHQRGHRRSGRSTVSLFYTDLNRDHVEIREIDKMGRKCVDSNQVFIDGEIRERT